MKKYPRQMLTVLWRWPPSPAPRSPPEQLTILWSLLQMEYEYHTTTPFQVIVLSCSSLIKGRLFCMCARNCRECEIIIFRFRTHVP